MKPSLQREVGQATRLLIRKTTGETVAVVLDAGPKGNSP
jgi:hypothetical protein